MKLPTGQDLNCEAIIPRYIRSLCNKPSSQAFSSHVPNVISLPPLCPDIPTAMDYNSCTCVLQHSVSFFLPPRSSTSTTVSSHSYYYALSRLLYHYRKPFSNSCDLLTDLGLRFTTVFIAPLFTLIFITACSEFVFVVCLIDQSCSRHRLSTLSS